MRAAQIIIVTFFTVAAMMNGCANTDSRSASTSPFNSNITYGVIDAIETVHRMAGDEMENKYRQQDTYHVRVRLDNGDYQTMAQQSITGLRVGDRIRIENDRVSRY